jgi:oligosaccharyltransferase complex subunit epsilon
MAPKKNISTTPSPSAIPTSAAKPTAGVTSASGQPTRAANKPSSATTSNSSSNGQVRNAQDLQNIGLGVWNKYVDQTPQRVKLLDAFLIFLMAVGVLQFVYCVIAGNFVSIHGIPGTKSTAGEQQRIIRSWSSGRQ